MRCEENLMGCKEDALQSSHVSQSSNSYTNVRTLPVYRFVLVGGRGLVTCYQTGSFNHADNQKEAMSRRAHIWFRSAATHGAVCKRGCMTLRAVWGG
jgi:hypothetical protein